MVKKSTLIVLIVYSVIVTLLLIKYWNINKKNSFDKNYEISWNTDNTKVRYYEKKNGHKVYEYFDSNFDYNFEQMREYRNNRGPISISYDLNEDGFFEQIDYFDFTNKYIGKTEDLDNDRVYEYYEIILESGDTLQLTDKNANGIM
jgi:hypothetical protein